MQVILNIKNEAVLESLIEIIKKFDNNDIEIVKIDDEIKYSDDYIDQHWKEMLSKALTFTDADLEKWKAEYGAYLAEKNK